MKKHISRNKGFTLIEILVAIVIFATAMFGGIKLINASIESNAYSRNSLNAISWAESVVEWFRYQPVYVGSSRNDFYYGTALPFTRIIDPYQTINGIVYKLTWTVSEIQGSDSEKVDVKMEWTEKNTPHSYIITFIKGRNSG
jgi:prepilin-type N-terminal cleavage/methylation domain-containing protein